MDRIERVIWYTVFLFLENFVITAGCGVWLQEQKDNSMDMRGILVILTNNTGQDWKNLMVVCDEAGCVRRTTYYFSGNGSVGDKFSFHQNKIYSKSFLSLIHFELYILRVRVLSEVWWILFFFRRGRYLTSIHHHQQIMSSSLCFYPPRSLN
jgi:hypothetical protein